MVIGWPHLGTISATVGPSRVLLWALAPSQLLVMQFVRHGGLCSSGVMVCRGWLSKWIHAKLVYVLYEGVPFKAEVLVGRDSIEAYPKVLGKS